MNIDSPSRYRGLLRLRHLQEVTEAKAEELATERLRFQAMREASPTAAVSSHQLFQTPAPLADQLAVRLLRQLGATEGLRILEPSAGLGRLYRAIRHRCGDVSITLVENSADCCRELYREIQTDDRAQLVQADFLTCDSQRLGGQFDAVLMNPPFTRGTDLKHIDHARQLLKPGGLLISLVYAGSAQARRYADRWELLPAGSFQTEGTRADVALVELR